MPPTIPSKQFKQALQVAIERELAIRAALPERFRSTGHRFKAAVRDIVSDAWESATRTEIGRAGSPCKGECAISVIPYCGAEHSPEPERPYGAVCTRKEGHPGPHVACGTKTHALKVWE